MIEPLVDYGFMRYGLAVSVIVGASSSVLSCLLVVRRQALMGDAVSPAVLLGVALGWIAGGRIGVFWGALAVGVTTGMAITYIERNSRVKLDAAMGVMLTFTFALGLAIISVVNPRGIDLFHILFGNVLGVGPAELTLTAVSGGLVLVGVLGLFRWFHLWSFDEPMAKALGVPTGLLHYVFTALLAATIVAALQAVGLVLVIAMLVTPGATAYLLADRLVTMMGIAVGVGVVAAVSGLYGSFYLDVASGPAIVIVASLAFFAAFLLAPRRGVATRSWRRWREGRRLLTDELLQAVTEAEEDGHVADLPTLTIATGVEAERVQRLLRRLCARGLLVARFHRWEFTDQGREWHEGRKRHLEAEPSSCGGRPLGLLGEGFASPARGR